LSNFFQKVGRGWGNAPRFYFLPRAFWEVWNLFAIEKGSKNFKIDFVYFPFYIEISLKIMYNFNKKFETGD
jgi:hypothetical protein